MSSEKATELFEGRKCSCSQAIFSAYNETLGLDSIDNDTCLKLSSAFCGGLANTGNICGALSGGLMILGLKYGCVKEDASIEEGMKAIEVGRQLIDEFTKIHGTTLCKDLINHDLNTPEDIQDAFAKGSFNNCTTFVKDTGTILDTLL